MSDEMGNVPPEPQQSYQQVPPPPPQYVAPPAPADGLSDTAAGAIAYITIIPAILFLVMPPYNQKPFVKFHAFQSLGINIAAFCLSILNVVPILGTLIFLVGMLVLLVVWILCVLKASQGGAFKLPVIGKFAAEQSGYSA